MTGYSLHIGLNRIDPAHYGSNGQLQGCENDAHDMQEIANLMGFDSSVLLNDEATVSNIADSIRRAAQSLNTGDIFFISYSGHGGQVPDTNGDEIDLNDETWCAYDRQLIDDELYSLWTSFKSGTRILVLSDSCHSGTVTKALKFEAVFAKAKEIPRFRTLPRGQMEETYRHNKDQYDRVQAENPLGDRGLVNASIILISGCQDWQLSADGVGNGLFTQTLKEVWNGSSFAGSYLDLHQEISDRMPDYQKPNYYRTGLPSAVFDNQRPFEI